MVAIVDLAIAARLTFLLASMRKNVFKRWEIFLLVSPESNNEPILRTDSLLKVMMAYTINTGLVTRYVDSIECRLAWF